MSDLYFKLPWPPTSQLYWDIGVHRVNSKSLSSGYRYIPTFTVSQIGQRYRDIARGVCGEIPKKKDSALRLRLILTPPDKRKRSIYKAVRSVIDSLVSIGVVAEESQFDEIIIKKTAPQPRQAMVQVVITEESYPVI